MPLLGNNAGMNRQEAIDKGYRIYCLGCGTVYKQAPTLEYEDGHGGRMINMCPCGSDLFTNLADEET